jgi:1-acyl-sn-glycerol-3-phosphate acyltransferase
MAKEKFFAATLKKILKLFFKRPRLINLSGEIKDKALFISNHSAASGPIVMSLFFPKKFAPWGTYEMCGNYRQRWDYMYRIFYIQKKGYGKVKAFIMATLVSVFSRYAYRTMGLIPTYKDARLKSTMEESIKTLDDGKGVLIFPENSQTGYKEVLDEYHGGFVALAKLYYKKSNEDLPVYNIYYHKKSNAMVIDKPRYIGRYLSQGYTISQIADIFRQRANELLKAIPQAS